MFKFCIYVVLCYPTLPYPGPTPPPSSIKAVSTNSDTGMRCSASSSTSSRAAAAVSGSGSGSSIRPGPSLVNQWVCCLIERHPIIADQHHQSITTIIQVPYRHNCSNDILNIHSRYMRWCWSYLKKKKKNIRNSDDDDKDKDSSDWSIDWSWWCWPHSSCQFN